MTRLSLLPALLLFVRAAAAAPLAVEPVAMVGDPAPGGTAAFTDVASGALNGEGDIAVLATAGGRNGAYTPGGVWAGRIGALKPVVQAGEPLPGITDATLHSLSFSGIDRTGAVLVSGIMQGPDVRPENMSAVWYGPGGGARLVGRAGEKLPGAAVNCRNVSAEGLAADGTILLGVSYASGTFSYAGKFGQYAPLAVPGRPVPGAPADAHLASFRSPPVCNAQGQFLFVGQSAAVVAPAAADIAWFGTPGALRPVARSGEAAPGMPPGNVFGRLMEVRGPIMNNSGGIAMIATIAAPGPPSALPLQGLWAGKPGALVLVASGDSRPPDAEGKPIFRLDENKLFLDDGGRVFVGGLVGAIGKAKPTVWVYDGKKTSRWAAEGEPLDVPGLDPGVRCAPAAEPAFTFGDDGTSLQIATLSGPGVDETNQAALVAYTPKKGWSLLARGGDALTQKGKSLGTLREVKWVGPPAADGHFLVVCTTAPSGKTGMFLGLMPKQ